MSGKDFTGVNRGNGEKNSVASVNSCSAHFYPQVSFPELPALQAGDHLLYYANCLADRVICLKTWSVVAHIEVAVGPYADGSGCYERAVAARADGVNCYPFRRQGLRYILRPTRWLQGRADDWFLRVAQGQRYDWLGLLCFTLAVKQGAPHRMFCSEFARNLCRAAGCPAFADSWPGDKTAPGSFLMSPAFDVIFEDANAR